MPIGNIISRVRGRVLRLVGAACLAATAAACGDSQLSQPLQYSGADAETWLAGTEEYRLASGDRLRITVFGQPEMSREYQIDGAGRLAFPLVGTFNARGMTPGALEEALVDKLDPNYVRNAAVSVELLTFRPFYIVGEVKVPGSYSYVPGMTVLNAVAIGGGYTYRARENNFIVRRPSGEGRVTQLAATADTPLLPGDIVTVRERYF
ncbi:MAG: polysaccharide biosynthesis/export family protein [Reyranellaceae bacterium]